MRPDRITKKDLDNLLHLYGSDLNKFGKILFPNEKNLTKKVYLSLTALKQYYPNPLLKLNIIFKPQSHGLFKKSKNIEQMFNNLYPKYQIKGIKKQEVRGLKFFILVDKRYLKKNEIELSLSKQK